MNLYRGTFSISFDVYAENEEEAEKFLYEELDMSITHGISAAAFALHDDLDVLIENTEKRDYWETVS